MNSSTFQGFWCPHFSKVVAVIGVLVIGGCTTENNTADSTDSAQVDGTEEDVNDTGFVNEAGVIYPGEQWPTADPEAAGFHPEGLEEAAQFADEVNSHCLMVVHDGYKIGEWYFDGWDARSEQNVFSVTKSVTGLAVGMAADRGFLKVDDPASLYIDEWRGTDSEAVTIAQLMNHTSGRYWEFYNDYLMMGADPDKTGFAVALSQQFSPGTVWEYNNAAVQTLDRLISEATGERLSDFVEDNLFSTIGMSSTMALDDTGNTIAYSDLSASCTDLARLGYLLLRNGRWGDLQVVSEAFLEAAFSPSSPLSEAYGYLFWLNRDGPWVGPSVSADEKPEGEGKMYPTLPEDMVLAEGMQNQLIVVLPSSNLVITRIGGIGDPVSAYLAGSVSDPAITETLVAQILAAEDK